MALVEEMAEYSPRKLGLSPPALKATDKLTGREKHLAYYSQTNPRSEIIGFVDISSPVALYKFFHLSLLIFFSGLQFLF